jgi:hypothetical protein
MDLKDKILSYTVMLELDIKEMYEERSRCLKENDQPNANFYHGRAKQMEKDKAILEKFLEDEE